MLEQIHIQNLGLVENATIEFDSNVTIFTGETGAGKSMLLSALLLLQGDKASDSTLRYGANQAIISSIWNITTNKAIKVWLEEKSIEYDATEIQIRRVIKANKRSQCFIQGVSVSLKELSECVGFLCEIHTQHEHQALFSTTSQLAIIDRYAGIEPQVIKFNQLLQSYEHNTRVLRKNKTDAQERARELDYLKFAVSEIEENNIQVKEDIHIMEELQVVSHADEIITIWNNIHNICNDETGVQIQLEEMYGYLSNLTELQPSIQEYGDRLNSMLLELKDLVVALKRESDSVEHLPPNKIMSLETRLSLLEHLKKKYGDSLEKVIRFCDDAKEKILYLENYDHNAEALQQKLVKDRAVLEQEALVISNIRKDNILSFSDEVNAVLDKLAMGNSCFSIELVQRDIKINGIDDVVFYMSPNKGIQKFPLIKIASGGELSRIMLAIKVISSKYEALQTLVLDEVDAGLGGHTARVLAQYLHKLGMNTQVICVTHLPIVAACARTHYCVKKQELDELVSVMVSRLGNDLRIQEIARMISGKEDDILAQNQAEQFLLLYAKD